MAQRPARLLAAGLDEAGRGSLAGPVVAAAVILRGSIPGVADSKTLAASRRGKLALLIKAEAMAWSLGVVWPSRIERINILQASLEAMAKAAATLSVQPGLLLLDGNQKIPEHTIAEVWHNRPFPEQVAIIKGDALEPAISAASILAKTFRDKLMESLNRRWPGYGFDVHKGYGTKAHYAALAQLGPCPIHRRSFRGVLKPGSLL